MTFATIDSRETTNIKLGSLNAVITALLERIKAERKELKSLYHYHSEKTAYLAQAERDVNRIWF